MSRLSELNSREVFQFLIGRLGTSDAPGAQAGALLFQFLIGRLGTIDLAQLLEG